MIDQFLLLSRTIFEQMLDSGKRLERQKNSTIFHIKEVHHRYNSQKHVAQIDDCICALSDNLLHGAPFCIVGNLYLQLETSWLQGMAQLNPTADEAIKIYNACFKYRGLKAAVYALASDYPQVLLDIMQADHSDDNLEHALVVLKETWADTGSKALSHALHTVFQQRSQLNTGEQIAEAMLNNIKEVLPSAYLEFLPYFSILPQKSVNAVPPFMPCAHHFCVITVSHQGFYDSFASILNYKLLECMLICAINTINEHPPGDIKLIIAHPHNGEAQGYSSFMVETTSAPDEILVKNILFKFCEIYALHEKGDKKFWQQTLQKAYLDSVLTTTPGPIKKSKI